MAAPRAAFLTPKAGAFSTSSSRTGARRFTYVPPANEAAAAAGEASSAARVSKEGTRTCGSGCFPINPTRVWTKSSKQAGFPLLIASRSGRRCTAMSLLPCARKTFPTYPITAAAALGSAEARAAAVEIAAVRSRRSGEARPARSAWRTSMRRAEREGSAERAERARARAAGSFEEVTKTSDSRSGSSGRSAAESLGRMRVARGRRRRMRARVALGAVRKTEVRAERAAAECGGERAREERWERKTRTSPWEGSAVNGAEDPDVTSVSVEESVDSVVVGSVGECSSA